MVQQALLLIQMLKAAIVYGQYALVREPSNFLQCPADKLLIDHTDFHVHTPLDVRRRHSYQARSVARSQARSGVPTGQSPMALPKAGPARGSAPSLVRRRLQGRATRDRRSGTSPGR